MILVLICLLLPLNSFSDRHHDLTSQIRCMVYDNQSIADSNAPLAKDMRVVVAKKINQGETNDAILMYMKKRYGDDVLYQPPWTKKTWFLWLMPACVFMAVLLFIGRMAFRGRSDLGIR